MPNDHDDNEEVKQVDISTPRYKLNEAAYINDILHKPGDEITYAGIPGHHMDPINAAAKVMKKKHDGKFIDPIEAMCKI